MQRTVVEVLGEKIAETTVAQAKKYREAERSAKELGENFKTRFENMLEEVNQLKHKNK